MLSCKDIDHSAFQKNVCIESQTICLIAAYLQEIANVGEINLIPQNL